MGLQGNRFGVVLVSFLRQFWFTVNASPSSRERGGSSRSLAARILSSATGIYNPRIFNIKSNIKIIIAYFEKKLILHVSKEAMSTRRADEPPNYARYRSRHAERRVALQRVGILQFPAACPRLYQQTTNSHARPSARNGTNGQSRPRCAVLDIRRAEPSALVLLGAHGSEPLNHRAPGDQKPRKPPPRPKPPPPCCA